MTKSSIHSIFSLTGILLLLLAAATALPAADKNAKTDESGWILPDAGFGDGWHLRLKDARAEAAKDNKPILILFSGPDWSSSSKKIESSVIRSREFTEFIRPSIVGLYIRYFVDGSAPDEQIEANHALRKSLCVEPVYPCSVLIASDGKKILGVLPGLPDKKVYLEWIAGLTGIKLPK